MNDEQNLWFVEQVNPQDYFKIVPDCRVFFNEPSFNELNKSKADEIYYLIIKRQNSARFGLIAGRIGNEIKIPFSAPYAYPVSILSESPEDTIDFALAALHKFFKREGIISITNILPPLFYDEHLLSGWISSYYRAGYKIINLDLNYALDLKKLNVPESVYLSIISKKGRKGFNRANKENIEIKKCETDKDYRKAYELVKIGHDSKGFPTHLTYEQLAETLSIVKHDAFIVKYKGIDIIGEFLYRINKRVVQGIYTGTHPDYLGCNGMNLLTYHTIRYYGDLGYEILDKATAGKDSIPNYGLCNFKESVGCERSLKYTFRKEL